MASFFGLWSQRLRRPAIPAIWLALSYIAALGGPFGTYENLGLLTRSLFWPSVIGVGIIAGVGIATLIDVALPGWPARLRCFLMALANALVLSAPTYLLARMLLAPVGTHGPQLLESAFVIFSVSLAAGCFRLLLQSAADEPEPAVEETHPLVEPPRLLERLEPALRGSLVRLSVSDHYVDVHTLAGTGTLLMRLADAIAETMPVDGLQVHRSHWVAVAAVRGSVRRSGRVFLLMTDGTEVPVSRNFQRAATQRGLITAASAEAAPNGRSAPPPPPAP